MTGLQIRRHDSASGTTLELSGVFDGKTANELRRAIEDHQSTNLTLDFSGVRTYVDLAVAVLTGAFQGRTVHLAGLPRHQERMFRYFGVSIDSPREVSGYGRPEELAAG